VLTWLGGLALIVSLAPLDYRLLKLADGEQVLTFRAKSHELVTMSGGQYYEFDPPHRGKTNKGLLAGGTRIIRKRNVDDSIYLWDMDTGAKRELRFKGLGPVYGVMSCASGGRLAIQYGWPEQEPSQSKCTTTIAVVDVQTGKLIRAVEGGVGGWSLSDDGRKLAYEASKSRCIDVDTGRLLHESDGNGIISPDGKYLFDATYPQNTIWNLEENRLVCKWPWRPGECDEAFAPRGDRFMDGTGVVRDILTSTVIGLMDDDRGPVFADGGKRVVWGEPGDGSKLVWQDLEGHGGLNDARNFWIAECDTAAETADAEGRLIHFDGSARDIPEWVQGIGRWLGFSVPLCVPSHQWLLIDARSGAVLIRGRDELLAVSSDGKYVASRDKQSSWLKLYELPTHRSLVFILAAGIGWTMLAFSFPSRQRRIISGPRMKAAVVRYGLLTTFE
jgi:hypothetical protein